MICSAAIDVTLTILRRGNSPEPSTEFDSKYEEMRYDNLNWVKSSSWRQSPTGVEIEALPDAVRASGLQEPGWGGPPLCRTLGAVLPGAVTLQPLVVLQVRPRRLVSAGRLSSRNPAALRASSWSGSRPFALVGG